MTTVTAARSRESSASARRPTSTFTSTVWCWTACTSATPKGCAQDQGPRGKVVDWRVPVGINGVRVKPGDLVFGDLDGVLVIRRGISTVDAFRTFEGDVAAPGGR